MVSVKSARVSNRVVPALLWKRLVAYLIDMIALSLIFTIPFYSYLSKYSGNVELLFTTKDTAISVFGFFMSLMILLYFIILEYKLGQTLGKMIMGIYVGSVLGNKPKLNQIFLRNVTKPFSIILLIDVLYMFFKGGNRRLFEVFSGTIVVEKELVLR